MKRLSGFRKWWMAAALVAVAAFAMGCGQTAPTGVDPAQLPSDSPQTVDPQGANATDWH